VRAYRAFLARVVRFLAVEAGIRQFLDLGTGIPAANNIHQAAQAAVPVQRWRPVSEAEAGTRSAMWGGVARKPPG
jgi:hypothetical protein